MTDAKRPAPPGQAPAGKSARPSVERAEALRDVMTHAVEVEKEVRKTVGPPRSSRRTVAIAISVPALLFCVFSLVFTPEFIWGPTTVALAPAERDANLRFTMFLLAQRIRSYRAANGRLPASLEAVGESPTGIAYAVVSDTVFQLTGEEAGQQLVLRSDAPASEFLGDAARRLRGASGR